jgi:hypothetical protein
MVFFASKNNSCTKELVIYAEQACLQKREAPVLCIGEAYATEVIEVIEGLEVRGAGYEISRYAV